ncbi:hypothetical protein RSAG8_07064, partial [Rhizoctonia solani AG-8 WAC10335]
MILTPFVMKRLCLNGMMSSRFKTFSLLSPSLSGYSSFQHPRTYVDTEQSAFFGESVRRPKEFHRSERRIATIEKEKETAKQNVFVSYGL